MLPPPTQALQPKTLMSDLFDSTLKLPPTPIWFSPSSCHLAGPIYQPSTWVSYLDTMFPALSLSNLWEQPKKCHPSEQDHLMFSHCLWSKPQSPCHVSACRWATSANLACNSPVTLPSFVPSICQTFSCPRTFVGVLLSAGNTLYSISIA